MNRVQPVVSSVFYRTAFLFPTRKKRDAPPEIRRVLIGSRAFSHSDDVGFLLSVCHNQNETLTRNKWIHLSWMLSFNSSPVHLFCRAVRDVASSTSPLRPVFDLNKARISFACWPWRSFRTTRSRQVGLYFVEILGDEVVVFFIWNWKKLKLGASRRDQFDCRCWRPIEGCRRRKCAFQISACSGKEVRRIEMDRKRVQFYNCQYELGANHILLAWIWFNLFPISTEWTTFPSSRIPSEPSAFERGWPRPLAISTSVFVFILAWVDVRAGMFSFFLFFFLDRRRRRWRRLRNRFWCLVVVLAGRTAC